MLRHIRERGSWMNWQQIALMDTDDLTDEFDIKESKSSEIHRKARQNESGLGAQHAIEVNNLYQ